MVYTNFNKIIFCMSCWLHSSELFFGEATVVALPWSSHCSFYCGGLCRKSELSNGLLL